MDATLIYNGPHLQRTKRYTLSPRHSLNSVVDMNWPQSLHHEQLSPLSKIKNRQSMQTQQVTSKHNQYVDKYLSQNLKISDSRVIRRQEKLGGEIQRSIVQRAGKQYSVGNRQQQGNSSLKLPKIEGDYSGRKNNVYPQIISGRSKNYFTKILRQRLKKYNIQDTVQ